MEEIERKSIAHLSPSLGRGIVWTGNKVYIIDLKNMYQPELAKDTNLSMWLQGPGDIEVIRDVGERPFTEVYEALRCEHNRERKKVAQSLG